MTSEGCIAAEKTHTGIKKARDPFDHALRGPAPEIGAGKSIGRGAPFRSRRARYSLLIFDFYLPAPMKNSESMPGPTWMPVYGS